jgi:arylsulfatase A-like enzyme
MPHDNILVLAIDGLRAAALGAYGNTTFPTPALDQFASESFLLDFAFADSVELTAVYRALWQSQHPLRPMTTNKTARSLSRILSDGVFSTTLITDDAEIGALATATRFEECVQIDGKAAARADDVSETCMARLFAASCEVLRPAEGKPSSPTKPRFVWVHSRGMIGPWDAPLELRESLLDLEEGDPEPDSSIEPPAFSLAESDDPDAAFTASCGYAAQVMVLDECIDMLQRCLSEGSSDERWLIVLLGCRGFTLGEHGQVGVGQGKTYSEVLQVPMLFRFPDGTGALARSQELVSHLDLVPSLLDWANSTPNEADVKFDGLSLLPLARSEAVRRRESLLATNESGELAIRTPEWCLHRGPVGNNAEEASIELFVRPDDRWEANNVASLCQDVVERLSAELEAMSSSPSGQDNLLASPQQPVR